MLAIELSLKLNFRITERFYNLIVAAASQSRSEKHFSNVVTFVQLLATEGLLMETQRDNIVNVVNSNMAWNERNMGDVEDWFRGEEDGSTVDPTTIAPPTTIGPPTTIAPTTIRTTAVETSEVPETTTDRAGSIILSLYLLGVCFIKSIF